MAVPAAAFRQALGMSLGMSGWSIVRALDEGFLELLSWDRDER
jgi:hypothetical protein